MTDQIKWKHGMIDPIIHREIRTAIKQGNLVRFEELIEADPSRLTMMTPFGNWLHVAASFGQLAIVKKLVEWGMDVNAYGGTADGTALHRAASDGYLDVVEFLFAQGSILDVSKPERNPLIGAIHSDHIDIVKFLIDHGIDIHAAYSGKIDKQKDAIAYAREWGKTEMVKLLAEKKQDVK